MKKVIVYTDGGCLGNPGPGGYGAVLIYGEHRRELSQGYNLTTNNRMELMACIAALQALKEPCQVELYSDSKYVVDGINQGWARRWRSNGWIRDKKTGARALNHDLWQVFLTLLEKHQVKLHWVKGHAGNPENERCDELARSAAARQPRLTDQAYLDSQSA